MFPFFFGCQLINYPYFRYRQITKLCMLTCRENLLIKVRPRLYVDVNGVGYEVNISLNTYAAIQHLNEGKLFTWLQVKEDGHTFYMVFFDKEEKEIFLLLISVSGVGAATARMMLSSHKT